MSQAIAVQMRRGKKDRTSLYVKIKNGNIYKFNEPVPAEKQDAFVKRIQEANHVIKLKHWTLVKRVH